MKILLTGGGTGGHFYPIVAVAQSLRKYAKEKKLLKLDLYYMAPEPYNQLLLDEYAIKFLNVPAGKRRTYFSLLNYTDLFKTAWGITKAIWKMFWIYPDVVFAKGGYVSFPAVLAAYFLRIPVVIHESDSVPGRMNAWAGKIAQKIAISYPQASEYFPKDKIALTGNPIREDIIHTARDGAHEFLNLQPNVPLILILGGSQGSQLINETIIDALAKLVDKYQVIHQAGKNNVEIVEETAKVVLHENPNKDRYHVYASLNDVALKMAAGTADIIVSRAGSTIFEIAVWGVPSILIPITESNGDHQRKNAYSYARTGAAVVIEENNLTSNILFSEIDRLMSDATLRGQMRKAALEFGHVNAADLIAAEILNIALQHEQ
jgi:UDP-N-acetylglucosamine--N-acetylmuramyl-(pentapeptide) pyrophosphoryl-undecaprenol N-acetylglucosamine transferase